MSVSLDKNTHVSHNQFYSCEESIQTINVTPRFSPPFLCYACHVKPIPGRFNKEKAKELGIPNDSSRGKLVKGESITLPDGREVNRSQFLLFAIFVTVQNEASLFCLMYRLFSMQYFFYLFLATLVANFYLIFR